MKTVRTIPLLLGTLCACLNGTAQISRSATWTLNHPRGDEPTATTTVPALSSTGRPVGTFDVTALCGSEFLNIRAKLSSAPQYEVVVIPKNLAAQVAHRSAVQVTLNRGTPVTTMSVLDDCCDFAGIQKSLFLVLRAPVTIPPRYEFRCFVKERQLVGITQYFYDQVFNGLESERQQIETIIRAFHLKVNDAFPENDYVFDVFFGEDQTGPTLIEVNPYGISDPCLFGTYERVEQGGFLMRTE